MTTWSKNMPNRKYYSAGANSYTDQIRKSILDDLKFRITKSIYDLKLKHNPSIDEIQGMIRLGMRLIGYNEFGPKELENEFGPEIQELYSREDTQQSSVKVEKTSAMFPKFNPICHLCGATIPLKYGPAAYTIGHSGGIFVYHTECIDYAEAQLNA